MHPCAALCIAGEEWSSCVLAIADDSVPAVETVDSNQSFSMFLFLALFFFFFTETPLFFFLAFVFSGRVSATELSGKRASRLAEELAKGA